jgi:hypothetical protein
MRINSTVCRKRSRGWNLLMRIKSAEIAPPYSLPHEQDTGAHAMVAANTTEPNVDEDIADEPIPAMQQLLDNPFLLLFIGIAMPTVLYIVWGVMEIVGIPIAK